MQGVLETAAYLGDRSHFYVSVEGCSKPVAVASQETQTLSGAGADTGLARLAKLERALDRPCWTQT